MEGISNILQSSIRQTFGSSGTDKQVRAVSLVPALLLGPLLPARERRVAIQYGYHSAPATGVLRRPSALQEEQNKL